MDMKFICGVMFAIIAASILIASATTMNYVMASQIQGKRNAAAVNGKFSAHRNSSHKTSGSQVQGSGNAVNVIRMQS